MNRDVRDAALQNGHIERLKARVRELEEGLTHIRDYRYSAEQARAIAASTLAGSDTYRINPVTRIDMRLKTHGND